MAQIEEIIGQQNIAQVIELNTQLNRLDETFMKILKSVKDTGQAMNTNAGTWSTLQKAQADTVAQTQKLTDAEKEQAKIQKEQAAAVEALHKQRTAALSKEMAEKQKAIDKEKEMAAAIAMEVKSIKDAEVQNKALLEAKKKLNLTTEEGRKKNEQYNQTINKNTEFIRQNSDAATKQRMNIGNYKSAIEGVGSKLMGMAAALGITVGAMQIFKGIIASTQTTADKFDQFLGGMKESLAFFARSIATLDFSNLLTGLREAYQEGKRYAASLDEIADRQRALGIQKLDIEGQILEQRIIAKNRQLDLDTRKKAIEEIVRLEELKLTKTKEVTQQSIENELHHARVISGLRDEEILDFVKNYDQYSAAVAEGGGLKAYLDGLVETQSQMVGDQLVITKNYDKQREAIGKLTDEQKANIELFTRTENLTDDVRAKIAKALGEDIKAVNDQKAGIELLTGLYNRLYKELIAGEDKAEKVAEVRAKEQEKAAMDEYNRQKNLYYAKNKTQEQEYQDFVKQQEQKAQLETDFHDLLMDYKEEEESQDFDNHLKEMDRLQKEKEEEIKAEEEKKQARLQTIGAVGEAGQQLFDLNSMRIDSEMIKLENAKARELEIAGDNAEQREKIEKKYDEELRKVRTQQARSDKAQSLFSSIINTAAAVVKALPNVFLAAFAGVMGAAQTALIAATPIPKFFKGTLSAPDGPVSVAEQGEELIRTRSGQLLLAREPMIMSGLKGARIFTNKQTREMMNRGGYDSPELRQTLERNNDKLIRVIQSKKEVHIDTRSGRITERDPNNGYLRTYLNKKIYR